MKNEDIYNKWSEFIDEYKEYFLSNREIWYNTLNKVKSYIDDNKKLPSDKDIIYKRLTVWIRMQVSNFKSKKCIMKEEEIYNKWKEFIYEYKEYFMNHHEIWYNTLDKVKLYIYENKKFPNKKDINQDISTLSCWIDCQIVNYKKRKQIMKYDNIYNEWNNFIKEYL